MAYYDYETLDDATRAYIDQVFLDEGKQLPVSFARIASSSMLIIFVSALILIGCYWFLFYPPLGNPLKETLIAMAFFFSVNLVSLDRHSVNVEIRQKLPLPQILLR